MDDYKSILDAISKGGYSEEALKLGEYIKELENKETNSSNVITGLESKVRELQDSNYKLYLNLTSSNTSSEVEEKEESIDEFIYNLATGGKK